MDTPAAPLARLSGSIADFFGSIGRAGSLEAENQQLRQLARAAELYIQSLEALKRENDNLRRLMDMPMSQGRIKIPARVIAHFPLENRMTLNVGTLDQVQPGLAVVAGDGLVGVVQTADPHSSQVRLLSSPRPFLIGAKVQRDPPAIGLLHGESPDRLTLEFAEVNTPVETGDEVVTSGYSELIPGGIPIGRVVQVYSDAEFGTRIAQVFPAVALGRVREVMVLR